MALHAALFIEQDAVLYVSRLGMLTALLHQSGYEINEAETMMDAMREAKESIAASWTAYATTCASIGIEPLELLASVGLALSPVAKMLTAQDVEPDSELLGSASELMRQLSGRI